ncbi:hypothetical protein GGI16_007656, partial [Coemansia sp. S142-1]
RYLFAQLEKNSTIPAIFVVNKIDLVQDQEKLAEKIKEYMAKYPFIVNGPLFISALGNTNVDELKALLLSKTKPGDWVVPAHASSDMSDMLRVEELIRVQWFTQLTGYLPYVVRQRNVGWEEVSVPQPPMTIYTDATSDDGNSAVLQSHVETRSTKELIIKQELIVTSAGEAKILLGKSGSKIKDIGRDAANNIAKALGIPTRLHLQGLVAVTGIMGVAVLLRYTIVPDEDKMIRSLSPELRAEYERNKDKRREQHDAIMAQIIENSKSDKPIWDVSSPPQAKRAADGSK